MNANDSLDLDEDLNQLEQKNFLSNFNKMDSYNTDFKDFKDIRISNEMNMNTENVNINRNEGQINLENDDYNPGEEANEELDQAIIIENLNSNFKKEETLNNDQILVGLEEEEIKDGCNRCGGCRLI